MWNAVAVPAPLGDQLRIWREETTQAALAKKAKVSPATIAHIEGGSRSATHEVGERIALALGLSAADRKTLHRLRTEQKVTAGSRTLLEDRVARLEAQMAEMQTVLEQVVAERAR